MRKFKQAFKPYRLLVATGFVYAALLLVLGFAYGASLSEFIFLPGVFLFTTLFVLFCFGVTAAFLLGRAFIKTPSKKRSLKSVSKKFDSYMGSWMNTERMAVVFASYLMFLALSFICVGKALIPFVNFYSWDPVFARADYILHGGHYPHEFVTPYVRRWNLSHFMDGSYIFWFFYKFFTFALCIFWDTDRQRQLRFLWAGLLSWIIIGTAMAIIFSSAGPVFFHEFYPALPDPYAGLVSGLQVINQTTHLRMLEVADILLSFARDDEVLGINGISAMPSMHIAIVWLVVLYARSVNRYFFIFAILYFLLIFVSAMYFGWHYAVDGYVAIIAVSAIWWASNPLAKQQLQQKPQKQP